MSKHYFEGDDINDLYLQIIESLTTNPQYRTSPRGMKIKENLDVTMKLTNPKKCLIAFKDRKINYAFAAIEKLEYLSGTTNPDRLIAYNNNFGSYVNKYGFFDGAYPDRMFYWYRYIHGLLKNDPDTRQAVMTIYGPQDRHESKDIPCTLNFQFFIRENKLHLIAHMRSNDVLWGLPYDTNGFCFILEGMAAMLGIEMGTYTLHAGSLHIYEEREEQLTTLLKNNEKLEIKVPTIEKCTFDEMQQNLAAFWNYERTARVGKYYSDEILDMLPDWLVEYCVIIKEYLSKRKDIY